MSKFSSTSLLNDWQDFIFNDQKLPNKDVDDFVVKKKYNLTVDLHGYTLSDANLAIKKLVLRAYNSGVKSINVITGKGTRSKTLDNPYKSKNLSILKYSVPEYILNNEDVKNKIKKIDIEELKNNKKGNFIIYIKNNEN